MAIINSDNIASVQFTVIVTDGGKKEDGEENN
jgi:hypothetical protein